MNATETAKEIRKALKAAFPGQKFSVRSSYFSMGSSVDITWTDGVSSLLVDEVVKQFERVSRCQYTGEILSGGNLYISTSRNVSDELLQWAKDSYTAAYGEEPNMNDYHTYQEVWGIANLNPYYATCELPELIEPSVEQEQEQDEVEQVTAMLEDVTVETVDAWYQADFAYNNKQDSILEYLQELESGEFESVSVHVSHKVKLSIKQWNAYIDGWLLIDLAWLSGKGGHEMINGKECFTDCVLVTCGHRSIIINPSGYGYARYVGLNVVRAIKLAA